MKVPTLLLLLAALAGLLLPAVQAIVAGVDLGGEFFKVALVKPGTPFEIVTNVHSKRKTETMVAFDGDERLYGADAATIGVRRPQSAYAQVRRFLGATLDDPLVVALLEDERFPYELEQDLERGSIALKHSDKQLFHAEELVAMVFSHARQITDAFAEAPVKDWVVTVPVYFSQAQRQALLDAAELAGVRVLSLINENTAAALQLAVHASVAPEDKPKRILFYNLGSTSLQVSVAELSAQVVPDGFKKNKTVSTFQMLSSAWDDSLGGSKFDLRLADHLAKEFSDKIGEDVRTLARPMAKIRAQAKKTKIVLSANEQIPVVMQSLYKDVDFFTSMTRGELENLCEDLFPRALAPVAAALEKAGLSVDDIDEIELIGGGVRMPKIQQQLKDYFGGKDLGVHLNGDEAMALGAAFRAANLSNSFRVRQVGMTDIATYPIGVRLTDSDYEEPSDENKEVDEDSKQWVKRASLFSETHRLGLRKSVAFSHTTDIAATFRYDKPSGLPAGVNVEIGKYQIRGIKNFHEEMKEKNLGEPKVTLSFELDSNGIARIAKAEATLEEEYEVEVEVKKPKKKAGKKKESDKESEDEAAGSDAGADGEAEADEPKEVKKEIKKKTHRAQLDVELVFEARDAASTANILPMTNAAKKESVKMLREMEKADNKRKDDLEAKNRLESYIYHARDALAAKEETVKQVTIPEQLEELENKLEETEEWLYDDGDKVDGSEYKKKVADLQKKLDAILFRVDELKELPIAINTAKEYAFSTRELVAEWVESKPQVTDDERQDVIEKVEDLESWLDESGKKQAAHPAHEAPVLTSDDVAKKVQGVKKLVSSLSKKPAPVKPKDESNETTTADDSASEADAAAEPSESSDEPADATATEDEVEVDDVKDEL